MPATFRGFRIPAAAVRRLIPAALALGSALHSVPSASVLAQAPAVSPAAVVVGFSTIKVIDQSTNAVVTTIDAGLGVWDSAVTSDGRRVFLSGMPFSGPQIRMLKAIDLSTGAVIAAEPPGDPTGYFGPPIALSPDDQTLYVLDQSGTLEARDAHTLALERVVASNITSLVQNQRSWMTVSPDGQWIYAAGVTDVTVVSTATGSVEAVIQCGGLWEGGYSFSSIIGAPVFLPAGTRAYVPVGNGVAVIDTSSHQLAKRIHVPGLNAGAAVSADGTVLHALTNSQLLSIDTSHYATVNAINLPTSNTYPMYKSLAISADGTRAFVTPWAAPNGVTIVDMAAGAVLTNVASGRADVFAVPGPADGLYVEPAVGTYGSTTLLAARLLVAGRGASAQRVSFALFGQPAGEAWTDGLGLARLPLNLAGINAGTFTGAISASFAGDVEAPAASATTSLVVYRATPSITWEPADLQAGTAVGPAQLGAAATVAGTFTYSPAGGTVLGTGFHTITAIFTPADAVNYTSVTVTRQIACNLWTDASHPSLVPSVKGLYPVVDPMRNRIYVERDIGWPNVEFAILDGRTHDRLGAISVSSVWGYGTALDVDGQRLLATDLNSQTLRIYDTSSLTLSETIQIGDWGLPVSVDGRSGLAWIGNYNGMKLIAVDLDAPPNDPGRLRSWPVCATAVAASSTTGYVYAACYNGTVTVVDGDPSRPTFGQSVASLALPGGWLASVAVDGRRNEVYVATNAYPSAGEVVILDGDPTKPTFNTQIGSLFLANQPGPVPQYMLPIAIAVNPVTERVYVLTSDTEFWTTGDSAISAFDARTRDLLAVTMVSSQNPSYGPLVVNPVTNRVYAGVGGAVAVVQDTVVESGLTPGDTQVAPVTVEMTAVNVTFADISTSGVTTATPIEATDQPLNLPGQFSIDGAPAYDITTTASYATPITLCFAVGIDDPDVFADIVILHGVSGAWKQETTTHNFETRQVCATVNSLSPFALGRLHTSYQVQPLFDPSKAFNGGATAAVKARLLDAAGANVSSASATLRATRLTRVGLSSPVPLEDAGRSNTGGNFRYDASIGGYLFNLKTKGLAPGTYVLSMRAGGDPTTRTVQFQVK